MERTPRPIRIGVYIATVKPEENEVNLQCIDGFWITQGGEEIEWFDLSWSDIDAMEHCIGAGLLEAS